MPKPSPSPSPSFREEWSELDKVLVGNGEPDILISGDDEDEGGASTVLFTTSCERPRESFTVVFPSAGGCCLHTSFSAER